MEPNEYQKSKEQYLECIYHAISLLTYKDDGTLNDGYKIIKNQRGLFIHLGITTMLSEAVRNGNQDFIEVFDAILEYHVTDITHEGDRKRKSDLFSKMIAALFESFHKNTTPESEDAKTVVLLNTIKFAFMIYHEFITLEEARDALIESAHLMAMGARRASQERRNDAEKN